MGRCLSVIGTRPLVDYQHKFDNTYLWGSYSPITGDSFVWEINGVDSKIFEQYLEEFSKNTPREYKIVVIDNAAFHGTNNIKVPDNIYLLRIPPYCPELNPCEQIWQYIKKRYKNKTFENIGQLRQWLWDMVRYAIWTRTWSNLSWLTKIIKKLFIATYYRNGIVPNLN